MTAPESQERHSGVGGRSSLIEQMCSQFLCESVEWQTAVTQC